MTGLAPERWRTHFNGAVQSFVFCVSHRLPGLQTWKALSTTTQFLSIQLSVTAPADEPANSAPATTAGPNRRHKPLVPMPMRGWLLYETGVNSTLLFFRLNGCTFVIAYAFQGFDRLERVVTLRDAVFV